MTIDYTVLTLAESGKALDAIAREAQDVFGALNGRQLNWRPDERRWGVAQCLDHLLSANRLMLAAAHAALDESQPRTIWQRLPVLPGLFGRLMIRSLTPTATRKLASRARARVRGAGPTSSDVPLARQREIVDAFIAASRAGDFEALLRILDPDVVVHADTAADRGPFAGVTEVRGAEAVTAQAMVFARFAAGARRATVNGGAGAVVYSGGRPFAVVSATIRGDRIVEMDFILRPERLRALGLGAG